MEAKIAKGVRQGYNLSPLLSNIYIEETLKEVRKENIGGVKIRGILVQMLRFADDIAEVRESEEDITNMNDKMLWTEKIKNTEVFRRMNTQKSIYNTQD